MTEPFVPNRVGITVRASVDVDLPVDEPELDPDEPQPPVELRYLCRAVRIGEGDRVWWQVAIENADELELPQDCVHHSAAYGLATVSRLEPDARPALEEFIRTDLEDMRLTSYGLEWMPPSEGVAR